MQKKLHIGIGATCCFLKSLIHPNKFIKNKYSNIEHNDRLWGIFVVGKGVNSIKSKDTNMIFSDKIILSMRRFMLLWVYEGLIGGGCHRVLCVSYPFTGSGI